MLRQFSGIGGVKSDADEISFGWIPFRPVSLAPSFDHKIQDLRYTLQGSLCSFYKVQGVNKVHCVHCFPYWFKFSSP